jgi:hypothetical protein
MEADVARRLLLTDSRAAARTALAASVVPAATTRANQQLPVALMIDAT